MLTVLSASILLPEEAMSLVEWGGAILIVGACLIEVLATPSDAKSPHA
jgi:drug/metabolite transporter (DMT)-like permease